jgi:hypothetical protein
VDKTIISMSTVTQLTSVELQSRMEMAYSVTGWKMPDGVLLSWVTLYLYQVVQEVGIVRGLRTYQNWQQKHSLQPTTSIDAQQKLATDRKPPSLAPDWTVTLCANPTFVDKAWQVIESVLNPMKVDLRLDATDSTKQHSFMTFPLTLRKDVVAAIISMLQNVGYLPLENTDDHVELTFEIKCNRIRPTLHVRL